jgi:hypothetical protein
MTQVSSDVLIEARGNIYDVTVEIDAEYQDFLDRAFLHALDAMGGTPARIQDIVRDLAGIGARAGGPFPLTPRLVEDLLVQLLASGTIALDLAGDELCVVRNRLAVPGGGRRTTMLRSYWQDVSTGAVVRLEAVKKWSADGNWERNSQEDATRPSSPVHRLPAAQKAAWHWLTEMSEAELFAALAPVEARDAEQLWRRARLVRVRRKEDDLLRLVLQGKRMDDGRVLVYEESFPPLLQRAWSRLPGMSSSTIATGWKPPERWADLVNAWCAAQTEALGTLHVGEDARGGREQAQDEGRAAASKMERALLSRLQCSFVPHGGTWPAAWQQRLRLDVHRIVLVSCKADIMRRIRSLIDSVNIDRRYLLLGPAGDPKQAGDWEVERITRQDVEALSLDDTTLLYGELPGPTVWVFSGLPIPQLLGPYARGSNLGSPGAVPERMALLTERLRDVTVACAELCDSVDRTSEPAALVTIRVRAEALSAQGRDLQIDLLAQSPSTWSTASLDEVLDVLVSDARVRRVIARSASSPLVAAARRNKRAGDVELVVWCDASSEVPAGTRRLDGAGPAEIVLFDDDLVLVGQCSDATDSTASIAASMPFLAVRDARFASEVRERTNAAR